MDEAILQRLVALEADRERNSAQHKEFYQKFTDLSVADGKRETTQDQILRSLTEIKADLAELKAKPAKRWEGLATSILQWAALLILGYVAARIGVAY